MVLDNFRTIGLIWDTANKSIIKTIKTASSDTTGRYLSVKILDGGQEVTLNGAKLQLYWEHPNFNTSGTDNFNTMNSGGLFNMTFSDEMLTNIGELNAHLVLTLPDGKITSDGFSIEVIKGANDGVVVPTNGAGLVKQIDGKIDKGNVTLNDLTQEVKLAMTGGSVAVVGENSVGTENIKDSAVTPRTTTFLELDTSVNMFDGEYTTAYIGGSTGSFSLIERNGNLAKLSVTPNTSYSIAIGQGDTNLKIATSTQEVSIGMGFDGAVSWHSKTNKQTLITTGENDMFLYISNGNVDGEAPYLKVVKSDTIVPIDKEEYPIVPSGVSIYSKSEVEDRVKDLENNIKDVENKYFHTVTGNLFDGNYIPNRYVGNNPPNLEFMVRDDYNLIAVPVKPNTTYTLLKEDTEKYGEYYYFKLATTSKEYEEIVSGDIFDGIQHANTLTHTSRYSFTTTATDKTLLVNVDRGNTEPYVEILEGVYSEFQFDGYGDILYRLNDNVIQTNSSLSKGEGLELKSTTDGVLITFPSTGNNNIIYDYGRHERSDIQLDVWRLRNISLYHHENGTTTSITSGDNEGVIRINGEADYLGGIHGDEIMRELYIYVNGIEHDGKNLSGVYDNIEFVTFTDLYHADTSNQAFTKERSVFFDKTGVHIKTRWHVLGTFELGHVRASLLSIHKREAGLDLIKTFRTNDDLRPKPISPVGETTPDRPSNERVNEVHLLGGEVTAKLWNISREGSESNNGTIMDFGERLKIYIDGFVGQTVSQGDIIVDEHKFVITTL